MIRSNHAHAKSVSNHYCQTCGVTRVDWLLVLVIPNCIDCDKLMDVFVILPFETSFEINLSNVTLVFSLVSMN